MHRPQRTQRFFVEKFTSGDGFGLIVFFWLGCTSGLSCLTLLAIGLSLGHLYYFLAGMMSGYVFYYLSKLAQDIMGSLQDE